jgi:glycerol kinase
VACSSVSLLKPSPLLDSLTAADRSVTFNSTHLRSYHGYDAPAVYCLEGSIAITGALVQWLRDNLGMISSSAEVEALANTVGDNGGVYFVPAFSGLFAPYWKSSARGGMVYNETLMQFQSDVLGVPVIRPQVAETTALGAAYAAGLATGFWSNIEDLRQNWQVDHTWEPKMDASAREQSYAMWKKAVTRTFDWVE